jgi:hypothetical protein
LAGDENGWTPVTVPAGAPAGDPLLDAASAAHGTDKVPPESFASKIGHKIMDAEHALAAHVVEGVDLVKSKAHELAPATERAIDKVYNVEKSIVGHVSNVVHDLKTKIFGHGTSAPAAEPPRGENEALKK